MRKAFGDLHKRLIHLTSYVSGMVIIGGNNGAAQSRFLRDFISEQDDAVNLAYIHAKAETTEAQYRQQLSSQLLGQVGVDVNASLSQQLGSLLGHEQQVLIALSGGEHVSNKLVKELWHLARNAESIEEGHMSIVLTGEQGWADGVRNHLDGAHLPVFVPYDFQQTDAPDVTDEPVSELEQMLADKRRAFNEHLTQRHKKQPLSGRKLGIVALCVLVFISCFGGLLWLLYPQLGTQAEPAGTDKAISVDAPPQPEVQKVAAVKAAPDKGDSKAKTEQADVSASEGDKVVTDWQSAVKALSPPKANTEAEDETQSEATSAPDAVHETVATATEQDAKESSEPTYLWDERRILTFPKQDYVLQLSAASHKDVLTAFLQQHKLASARRYQTRRYGGDWHVLIAKDSYPTLAAARQALQALPAVLQQEGAFAKKVSQVHREIEQGYADDSQQP